MKLYKYRLVALSLIGAALLVPGITSANMMTDQSTTTASASADEQKGQAIFAQLQNKQTSCVKLTNDDFDVMGDFFMGRMMGSAHDSMDQQMAQKLGANGERQTHIAMGQRLSGCNVNASYPNSAGDYPAMAWTGMTGSESNGWGMMSNDSRSTWSITDTTLSILLAVATAAALLGWLRRPVVTTTEGSK